MRYLFRLSLLAIGFVITANGGWTADFGTKLKIEQKKDKIVVYAGKEVVTEYRTATDQKYPYFYPVNGPATGSSVTTETSEPYPHHHSLFFACDKVNGGNYWQDVLERGRIVSDSIEIVKGQGESVQFVNCCTWSRPDAPSPLKDRRTITISAPSPTLRIIDFTIDVQALIDVEVLKTNHSLFSARMVPELSVKSGGKLINANGQSGEAETFGQRSSWCHYSGKRPGTDTVEGLVIFSHSDNADSPSRWFTRDYGFFSPTPMYWLEGDKATMDQGDSNQLRYRVLVHSGELSAPYIQQLYDNWAR